MLRKLLFLLFCLVTAPVIAVAQSSTPENDFQFWSDTSFSKPLTLAADGRTELLSLNFGTTIRMFNDATRPADRRLSIGLERRLTGRFSIGSGYVFRSSNQTGAETETEHRVRIDGNAKFEIGELGIRLRSRVEHLMKVNDSDTTRFRQRILMSHPVKVRGREIFSPFGSAEIFYDLSVTRLTRDELILGVTRKINSSFSIEPIIGLRRNRSSSFRNVGIVGINLKFNLPK